MVNKIGGMIVERLNSATLKLTTPTGFEIKLFATEDVPIDRASLREAISLGSIRDTISLLQGDFFRNVPTRMGSCILTPDFHRASGIPVGTVMETSGFVFPKSAGNDIGCGMRLLKTSLKYDDILGYLDNLKPILRRFFFEGGRDIAMTSECRAGMLRNGIQGLKIPTNEKGVWNKINQKVLDNEYLNSHQNGKWQTKDSWQFDDYIKGSGGLSRDAAIGSVGGGNHFCEVQVVDELLDKKIAWKLGLKKDDICVMIHSGSLGLGAMVADAFLQIAEKAYPKNITRPNHGFMPLPIVASGSSSGNDYISAMGNAANFAIVNRFMMGIMVIQALEQCLSREINFETIWDAPHNLVWRDKNVIIHRKGSCPALNEEPVLIPGSMGDYSYILQGLGNEETLQSAPHGAGRLLSRNAARIEDDDLEKIKVVTPLDPLRIRGEVAKRHHKELMEEAPRAYKNVKPIIDTVELSGMAKAAVRLKPLLTVKG